MTINGKIDSFTAKSEEEEKIGFHIHRPTHTGHLVM